MKAVVVSAYGDPSVLELADLPTPEPLPTEVRVRVEATSINPVDAKTRQGKGMAPVLGDPPVVLGWDVAGTVDALGAGVTTLAVGDRVLGMPWFPRAAGAHAELVTAPARQFVRAPEALATTEAGALPLAGLTAWQILVDLAAVEQGQRVLVHGAAGGVGHLAVQIAAARGAHVLATASAPKHEFLRGLGVQEPIDYNAVPFEDQVGDLDLVVDLVGGDTSARSVAALRRGGLLVTVPSASDSPTEAAAAAGVRLARILVEPDQIGLRGLVRLAEEGALRVEVSQVLPLEDAADAHRLIESGRTRGKIALTVG